MAASHPSALNSLHALGIAAACLDGDGCIEDANAGLADILNSTPDALRGTSLVQAISAICSEGENQAAFRISNAGGDTWYRVDRHGAVALLVDVTTERCVVEDMRAF